MALIRTFVAVEFSEFLKEEISQIQQQLKKDIKYLKWVSVSNFHLTLKFLGDVESRQIEEMADVLAKSVKGFRVINLNFSGLGGFPKIQQPRVVWLGVGQGKSEMVGLQKIVENGLITQGFVADKQPYSPHLTLARAFADTDLQAVGESLSQIMIQPTRSDVIQSIKIMQSDLRPQGPIYTCLAEVKF